MPLVVGLKTIYVSDDHVTPTALRTLSRNTLDNFFPPYDHVVEENKFALARLAATNIRRDNRVPRNTGNHQKLRV